jgi:hypothetical protein
MNCLYSEVNTCSTGQEMSLTSSKLKIHYCIRKSSPLVYILSQTNSVHTLSLYLSRFILKLFLHLRLGFASSLFLQIFPRIPEHISRNSQGCYTSRLFNRPSFRDRITICRGDPNFAVTCGLLLLCPCK